MRTKFALEKPLKPSGSSKLRPAFFFSVKEQVEFLPLVGVRKTAIATLLFQLKKKGQLVAVSNRAGSSGATYRKA